jgi:hypothetical protein
MIMQSYQRALIDSAWVVRAWYLKYYYILLDA